MSAKLALSLHAFGPHVLDACAIAACDVSLSAEG